MRIRPRFYIGGAVIALAIAYLIVSAIRSTSEYYLTVDEVSARQAELGRDPIRVAGRVKPGTISWEPNTLTLKFVIVPIPDAPAATPVRPVSVKAVDSVSFPVFCEGQPKPDMLAENRDVIVEGKLTAGGVIIASQVMTSCPSKYQPKQSQ
ncbi:MAG TPA: cytochrome c maturation protein CcmE [Sporolactobacillaceae bacterium]|nr:cytochrome c maturation protein CcmE [Sporolactobacillaceae bacterium]